jgi:cytidylate kinase
MKAADDAVIIDTSELTAEQVLAKVLELVKRSALKGVDA